MSEEERIKEKEFNRFLIFLSIVVLILVINLIIILLLDNGVLSFGTYFQNIEITYILCIISFVWGNLTLILALIVWYKYDKEVTKKENERK